MSVLAILTLALCIFFHHNIFLIYYATCNEIEITKKDKPVKAYTFFTISMHIPAATVTPESLIANLDN